MKTGKHPAGNLREELHDLRQAIHDMLSQFRTLHSPIRESQEKVPLASRQLRKITAETEAATTRMLDMAEAITTRESSLIGKLNALQDQAERRGAGDLSGEIRACRELAEQNHNDTFAIMEALQFQDITSQQMSHTMELLQGIETRLRSILGGIELDQDAEPPKAEAEPKKKVAYDPHAQFNPGGTGQKDVDSVIDSFRARK